MIRRLLLTVSLILALPAAAAAQTNPVPPLVTTAAASSITTNAATITGTVDPNGAATTYEIQYGTSSAYGLRSSPRNAGSGGDPVAISVRLTGLTQNTIYHYRLVATNAAGVRSSADRSLRTQATPAPLVTIGPAGPIFARAATVTGTVNPRGNPTRYRFEFGRGTSLNLRTAYVDAGDGTVALPVARTLTLRPSQTYSYRLVAVSAAGTARSAVRRFRTAGECATRHPAKLSIARASTAGDFIDVLAPITSRASGRPLVDYHAAGQHTRFTVPINTASGWIRFRRSVTSAQARLGTGILTIAYAGDSDTRAQSVRLRAARNKARLDLSRPQIVDGRIQASGTISSSARGVVRLQLSYQLHCASRLLELRGSIADGRWSIDEPLSPQTLAEIGARIGAVHSYTLFTGYLPARMRGEMRAFQVLP
ncbi:MAG: fibronectin type III domain-containing protein [Solirubrobacteraceae bacterium]|nr:fibronectin type III domain-containing protein [Solirubrobacteraceae bacterium]